MDWTSLIQKIHNGTKTHAEARYCWKIKQAGSNIGPRSWDEAQTIYTDNASINVKITNNRKRREKKAHEKTKNSAWNVIMWKRVMMYMWMYKLEGDSRTKREAFSSFHALTAWWWCQRRRRNRKSMKKKNQMWVWSNKLDRMKININMNDHIAMDANIRTRWKVL